MTVLVAGATGFIGQKVVSALTASGAGVRVLARPASDVRSLEQAGAEIVQGDVTDEGSVRAAAMGCEALLNLAVPPRHSPRATHHEVNVIGAANVARAAAAAQAHLVHVSTCAIYGSTGSEPATEERPPAPATDYAGSKLAGETVVKREMGNGAVVVARLSSVYGPGNRRGANVFRDTRSGRLVTIGNGHQRFDLAYVDDVVHGLIACLERRADGVVTYNLGVTVPATRDDFLRAVAAACETEPRRIALPTFPFAAAAFLDRHLVRRAGVSSAFLHRFTAIGPRAYDCAKAMRELGYETRVPLTEGARMTYEWFRDSTTLLRATG